MYGVVYILIELCYLQHPLLIIVHLHLLEHDRIVTNSQGFATGSGHLPTYDFPGFDIGKLLLVGFVGHLWIEIGENSRALIILRMIGVVDLKIFNGDMLRHIAGVAKIMLTGIGSTDGFKFKDILWRYIYL